MRTELTEQAREDLIRKRSEVESAASEVALRGELKLGRGIRVATYVMLANGLGVIIIGVFAWVATGSPAVVVAILLGAWWLVKAVLAMKAIRRGPGRAYRLNA